MKKLWCDVHLAIFILRQIPNISWEAIAKAQGISPLLFEQLTNFSYAKLCSQRPELNGFVVNPHTIEMRKYEIKDYNWKLYASRAKLDREHFVDHFITFIKNKMIFDDAETQALLEALSHNPFLPSSKQEALQVYQNAVSEVKQQEGTVKTIKPQESGDNAKMHPSLTMSIAFLVKMMMVRVCSPIRPGKTFFLR
ncbi:hypothetical protein [Campylobacter showae]|uniref:hypothetical protein n=1 Tax=Campylobacter showae TaxID=204 RepID=UPI0013D2C1CF|nr:hypothetical protein [Campylobacter showae]